MFNINLKKFTIVFLVFLVPAVAYYSYKKNKKSEEEKVFSRIYKEGIWGGGSGPGSSPQHAGPYLELLQTYFNDPNIKTIFDLGCGDWQLMNTIQVPDNKVYKGFDIVKGVIKYNAKHYQKKNITFYHIHELTDFSKQKGDLLVVKDVLQHWQISKIKYFIDNILPNFKYALITNDYTSSRFNSSNDEIDNGGWRMINLENEPFNIKNTKFF
jgi:hypothetical protein